MPVYNGERYLKDAIDSILGQTFEDLELLIVDNASTDATPLIASEYGARDARVKYVRFRENYGPAHTGMRASNSRPAGTSSGPRMMMCALPNSSNGALPFLTRTLRPSSHIP